ncbi:YHYH protein [Bizionia gelidisalsuginis]|uniref:YHYH protein n=1 Tax=Bizionia gelidisalsuginis TaxID=291188 RepID=A0ABY3MBF6_9FLAO|nr:YHYH protein [Bizionia gelidisalsuginis]TYC14110.1 YHYH protein [Bizionia gelidisalsuginis]
MKNYFSTKLAIASIVIVFLGCSSDENTSDPSSTSETDVSITDELHLAYSEFSPENVTVLLDGNSVVIESNGMPNHTSPYWSNTTERVATDPMGNELVTPAASENHVLFVEPTVTSYEQMAPGNIDNFNGEYSLTVPANPTLASSSSATGLGPIGIAISGAMIYNDEEGPNVPLNNAVGSLDYTAAHTGPQSYHYHLETKAWSNDDNNLIGVMADGFFLYGRKCNSTGDYPADLDASGGHTSTTQHTTDAEYHYHIQNEVFLNQFYILFPGDYQGTPSAIQ